MSKPDESLRENKKEETTDSKREVLVNEAGIVISAPQPISVEHSGDDEAEDEDKEEDSDEDSVDGSATGVDSGEWATVDRDEATIEPNQILAASDDRENDEDSRKNSGEGSKENSKDIESPIAPGTGREESEVEQVEIASPPAEKVDASEENERIENSTVDESKADDSLEETLEEKVENSNPTAPVGNPTRSPAPPEKPWLQYESTDHSTDEKRGVSKVTSEPAKPWLEFAENTVKKTMMEPALTRKKKREPEQVQDVEPLIKGVLADDTGIGTDEEDPLPGSTLKGRYRVSNVLKKTSFATIYRAKCIDSNKNVTIKTPNHNDAELNRLFASEAEAVVELSHRNLVERVEKFESSDGKCFLVSDFPAAISLEELIGTVEKIGTREEFSLLFLKLCEGLEYLHSKNILHGNLDPSNILLVDIDGEIEVQLDEYGFEAFREQVTSSQKLSTEDTDLRFASPERCKGAKLTPASDIYQLGALAYFMMTGSPPYKRETRDELKFAHCNGEVIPESLQKSGSQVVRSDLINQLIAEMLDSDIDWRTQSVSTVKESIEAWVLAEPSEIDLEAAETEAFSEGSNNTQSEGSPEDLYGLRKNPISTTVHNLVALKRKQMEREQTLVGQFVSAVATEGPKRSPMRSAMMLAGTIAASICLLIGIFYLYQHREALIDSFVKLSVAVSPSRGQSEESSDLERELFPEEAESSDSTKPDNTNKTAQIPATSHAPNQTAGSVPQHTPGNRSASARRRARKFDYAESPTYMPFIPKHKGTEPKVVR